MSGPTDRVTTVTLHTPDTEPASYTLVEYVPLEPDAFPHDDECAGHLATETPDGRRIEVAAVWSLAFVTNSDDQVRVADASAFGSRIARCVNALAGMSDADIDEWLDADDPSGGHAGAVRRRLGPGAMPAITTREVLDTLVADSAKLAALAPDRQADDVLLVEAADRLLRAMGVYDADGLGYDQKTTPETREALEEAGFNPLVIEAVCDVLDELAEATSRNQP